MKRVELYGRVRHAVMIEGLSQREAARCFGIDPRTVRKMLSYSVPPGYVRTRPPVRPKLDPFIGIIDRILEEDKDRPKKQRHTSKRIFERLRDEYGFTGKITIVKDYICGVRQRRREMFVPLTHPPGHAQVDFGEALAVIGGVERKIHFLAMSLPHSDACFVKAYPGETTEAFCGGHVSGFSFFGGVPRSILYDNTRIAVARILGDGKRQRTRVFSELRSHYLFEDRLLRRENLLKALRRVQSNKGAPGVDGMRVEELPDYLRKEWHTIREQLLSESYVPSPVREVQLPKPGGGTRMLGIPTVLDRFITQAMLQVMSLLFDTDFSDHSYGFRPGRSALQAVGQARDYIAQGHRWVVDLDLERFFDQVNHDMLMSRVAKKVEDKRLLRLIRRYLNAGIMKEGMVSIREAGTPQGSPLSPLLSNILLDDLDKELERRGHRFCRYADDANVYVRSQRAGERVMESLTNAIS